MNALDWTSRPARWAATGLLGLTLSAGTSACNRGGDSADGSGTSVTSPNGTPVVAAQLPVGQLAVIPEGAQLIVTIDWRAAVERARQIAGLFGVEVTDAMVDEAARLLLTESGAPPELIARLQPSALREVTFAIYETSAGNSDAILVMNREFLRDAPADGQTENLLGDRPEQPILAGRNGQLLMVDPGLWNRIQADGTTFTTAAALEARLPGLLDGAAIAVLMPAQSELTRGMASELAAAGRTLDLQGFGFAMGTDGSARAAIRTSTPETITGLVGGAQQTLTSLIDGLRAELPASAHANINYLQLAKNAVWSTLAIDTTGDLVTMRVEAPTCGQVPPLLHVAAMIGGGIASDGTAFRPFEPVTVARAATCGPMDGPAPNLRRDLFRLGLGPAGAPGIVASYDLGAALRATAPTFAGMLPVPMDHGAIRTALGEQVAGLDMWGGNETTLVVAGWPEASQGVAVMPAGFHSYLIQAFEAPLPGEAVPGMGTLVFIDPTYRAAAINAPSELGIFGRLDAAVPASAVFMAAVPGSMLQPFTPQLGDLPQLQGVLRATDAIVLSIDGDLATHIRLIVPSGAEGHARAINEAIEGAVQAVVTEMAGTGLPTSLVQSATGWLRASAPSDTLVAVDVSAVGVAMPVLAAFGVIGALMPNDDPYRYGYVETEAAPEYPSGWPSQDAVVPQQDTLRPGVANDKP